MSSLNFKKLKQMDLKPLLRHCDKYMRPKADHSNKEDRNDQVTKGSR